MMLMSLHLQVVCQREELASKVGQLCWMRKVSYRANGIKYVEQLDESASSFILFSSTNSTMQRNATNTS